MKVTRHQDIKRIIIDPGEYYVSDQNLIISTLLGSCVSACLWDPVHRIIGMNHFLLAHKRYAQDLPVIASEAGRYGIHSMELLINSMLQLGAEKHLLRAKAFGGGNVIRNIGTQDNFFAVGEVNTRFIREFLQAENIPLENAHLGGDVGRVIHFHALDFSVYLKRIEQQQDTQLAQQERAYWTQSLVAQEQQESNAPTQVQYW